jgi:hypothetical protein
MKSDVPVQLVLVDPPAGVDYGIQKGSGARHETLFVQRRGPGDVCFRFSLKVKDTGKDGLPNFHGPLAQGTPANRFLYVDVGTYAGQKDTPWARRMKVPLQGITWLLIEKVTSKAGHRLLARIPGTAADGGPNCATVKLLSGWTVVKDKRD